MFLSMYREETKENADQNRVSVEMRKEEDVKPEKELLKPRRKTKSRSP